MATSSSSAKISLKLLVDKKGKKVLFAEAGKDTVDFLFSILTLPLATVIRLLSKQGMVGCLSNLYKSIDKLNDDYVQPNHHKDTVLKPIVHTTTESTHSFFLTQSSSNCKIKLYACSSYNNHKFLSYNPDSLCPSCNRTMNDEMVLVEGKNVSGKAVAAAAGAGGGGGGFVKGVVTYMVMDDLEVSPMSTITGITLLNKFNVMHVGDLEEQVVDLDMAKALKLLKTSLCSKNVLTSVFL